MNAQIAYNLAYQAFFSGKRYDSNPYEIGTPESEVWNQTFQNLINWLNMVQANIQPV